MPISIRIKRGVGGAPATLLRGELAYDETNQKLYVGSGDSGSDDANGLPIATSVVELTTPPTVLADLADISVGSGASDGDVLVYDSATSEWVAEALSIAWDSVTSKPTFATVATTGDYDDLSGKPTSLTPTAHKASHATGGTDALSPSDIGALASSLKGANNGVAELDGSGKLPTSQLPNLAVSDFLGEVANEAAMLALTGQKGDWASRTDSGAVWIITGDTPSSIGSWTQLSYPAAPVASVNGETGTVVLDHTDVGAAASSHTHSASDITSGLATVATTGAYSDLSGTPTLATVATTGAYSDLSGTPTLGTAAASATTDFAAASHTHSASDITSGLATVATTGAYSDLSGTPTLGTAAASATGDFAAVSHTHAASDINSGTLDIDRIPTGSTSSTVCIGDDARLSDNRDPNSHMHGNITNAGAIGSTSGLPVKTGTGGVLEAGAFGTGEGEFCEGDDSRLSDARTPTAHNHTVTLEISGFIEAPEAKTYVLSPSIPAAITIINVKAKTGSGTCDIKLQDDGVDISDTSINDVSTSVSSPASEPSATVASGSVLALVVSDISSGAPEDLAFSVHYTVASANNA